MELNASDSAHTMPAFAQGTHAHRHTVNSALVSLSALGVSPSRILLRRSGRDGSPAGTIVRQRPQPGEELTTNTLVELDISGLGFVHALPVGLWDSGGDAEPGTRELLEPFDDPLEKLRHWFHEGAPLFRISPQDADACARWLALFGVDAAAWPRALWFRLASLIARVPQLSCSQQGCAFLLDALLGLPVKSFRYEACETNLPDEALSLLGERATQLGISMLLGDRVEELAKLQIELGPVTLAAYERFVESRESASLLRRTLELIMPASLQYEVTWAVLDATRAPRLGLAEHNARLGINTHLGDELGAVTQSFAYDEESPATQTLGATA